MLIRFCCEEMRKLCMAGNKKKTDLKWVRYEIDVTEGSVCLFCGAKITIEVKGEK